MRRIEIWAITISLTAAVLYLYQLGGPSLGASEAYSGFAACQSSLAGVIDKSSQLDPGKSPLYAIALHFFAGIFGCSEFSLRAFSVIFALVNIGLLFALTRDLFGDEVAVATIALWSLNPLTVTLARWARMYQMEITFVLAHVLSLRRASRSSPIAWTAIAAVTGSLMLYVHLGGILILAADIAMLIRAQWRERRVAAGWTAVAIALLLFLPYAHSSARQADSILFGHYLDWIGQSAGTSRLTGIVFAAVVAAIGIYLVFGPAWRTENERNEPLRWVVMWGFVPFAALIVGSSLIHPMFEVRYLAPALPALAILAACGLDALGERVRNLAQAAAVTLLIMLFFGYYKNDEPWRRLAREFSAAATAREPIFFESGFFLSSESAGRDLNAAFPDGFFRIPFDYYFRGTNPQRAINPFQTGHSRQTIADAAIANGGAWLLSGRPVKNAVAEMPSEADLRVELRLATPSARLYHIVPVERVSGASSPTHPELH